jgi:spore germination protein YaaH
MHMQRTSFVVSSAFFAGLVVVLATSIPSVASAAQWSRPFEISGWIPYWRSATGTTDVLPHLAQLTEVNPFGYTVTQEGRLNDAAVLSQEPWTTLRAQAKAQNVRYIPTVMWSDKEAMHNVLCDTTKRALLVRIIADEVQVNDFDGIDIDFEGKKYETKQCFSSFLKELYAAMGDKWVQCTIESRTPLGDLYYGHDMPKDAGQYVNDFAVINKYCDRVRFMTYDQQTADQKREAEVKEPYAPVSDTKWVEKAIREAMKSIPANKIVLGIPTYGYEWDVKTYANDEHTYDLLWSFNPQWGLDLAAKYNITPGRNAAGEMGFTYFPEGSPLSLPRPNTPWPWNLIASAASALTTTQNTNLSYRLVTWQDSQAIADKVALAKQLGIRGVAVFKFDGGQDPKMWDVLK